MRNICLALMVCLGVVVAQSEAGRAAIIDFEDNAVTNNNSLNPVTSRGFIFSKVDNVMGILADPPDCFPDCSDNGSKYLYNFLGTSITTMTRSGGGTFSLLSVDLAEMFDVAGLADLGAADDNAARVELVGNLSGGGTVSVSFTLDGVSDGPGPLVDFETFLLPAGFVDLESVVITSFDANEEPDGHIGMDNFVVASVSEPLSLALLGFGLLAAGAARRRLR